MHKIEDIPIIGKKNFILYKLFQRGKREKKVVQTKNWSVGNKVKIYPAILSFNFHYQIFGEHGQPN